MHQPQKARRWFQFHLASAVVMLVVAGGLVGQNLKLRNNAPEHYRPFFMGWPCTFAFEVVQAFNGETEGDPTPDYYWHFALFPAAAINFATALGIVMIAGSAAEAVVRRVKRPTKR